MKTPKVIVAAAASFLLSIFAQAATQPPETKIIIQSVAVEEFPSDAPCYMIFADGVDPETFRESGAAKELENALGKLGYSMVSSQNEAAVFIRIYYEAFEPYETTVQINKRPTIDYSNASSTKNYAAMMKGGRYQQLADPTRAKNRNEVGAVLGPSGEVIMLSEQEANAPKKVVSDPESMVATVHPIILEVSAWQVSQESGPEQLWATLATYNNLKDEEIEAQLRDMCEASTRFIGKNLKGDKLIKRK